MKDKELRKKLQEAGIIYSEDWPWITYEWTSLPTLIERVRATEQKLDALGSLLGYEYECPPSARWQKKKK